jgi:YD repeat-containing protein
VRSKTIRPDGHTITTMTYGSGHVHGMMLDKLEAIAVERDDLHREINRTQTNQLSQILNYDAAGRLKEQLIGSANGELNVRRYKYDDVG